MISVEMEFACHSNVTNEEWIETWAIDVEYDGEDIAWEFDEMICDGGRSDEVTTLLLATPEEHWSSAGVREIVTELSDLDLEHLSDELHDYHLSY